MSAYRPPSCSCGETNSKNFYRKVKNLCKVCYNKRQKKRYDTDKSKSKAYYNQRFWDIKLKMAQFRAKKNNLPFDLTKEYLLELLHKQDSCCVYSGLEFIPGNKHYCASLDRRIPKLGYVKTNVQLVVNCVNTMKNNLSEEEFLWIVDKISSKTK